MSILDNPKKHYKVEHTVHDLIDWDIWYPLIKIIWSAILIGGFIYLLKKGVF